MEVLKNTIYIVSTPIGNLEDITFRAIQVLNDVDFIMAEDTRVSVKLLNHYNIKKEMIAYHSHSSDVRVNTCLSKIENGMSAALISDAGTPCISDPGVSLVAEALKRNISVVPIPGVTAFTTLLQASGLPCNNFAFFGFLSNKGGTRKNQLKNIHENEKKVAIIYESVHRIEACIKDINDIFGEETPIVLGRELTKQFEQIVRDKAINVLDFLINKSIIIKGEFCVLIDNRAQKKYKV